MTIFIFIRQKQSLGSLHLEFLGNIAKSLFGKCIFSHLQSTIKSASSAEFLSDWELLPWTLAVIFLFVFGFLGYTIALWATVWAIGWTDNRYSIILSWEVMPADRNLDFWGYFLSFKGLFIFHKGSFKLFRCVTNKIITCLALKKGNPLIDFYFNVYTALIWSIVFHKVRFNDEFAGAAFVRRHRNLYIVPMSLLFLQDWALLPFVSKCFFVFERSTSILLCFFV